MSQQKPKISTSFSYETLEETLDVRPQGAQMQIGIPKEIAFQENRIALTPEAVGVIVSNGHQVTIEHNAGEAAHFKDNWDNDRVPSMNTSAEQTHSSHARLAGIVADKKAAIWINHDLPTFDSLKHSPDFYE